MADEKVNDKKPDKDEDVTNKQSNIVTDLKKNTLDPQRMV
jgi:hypothetical protein